VGFLDRLLARAEKPRGKERDGLTLHAGGTLDVVGESYRQPALEKAARIATSRAGHIGYLDRQAAVDYAPVFEELQRQGVSIGACPAYLTGGDGYSWGAVLCISSPDVVVEDLRASG
jgi:hypothetical protein